MEESQRSTAILIVDDDEDDTIMTIRAVERLKLQHGVIPIPDGQELMNYLNRSGLYADAKRFPRPALILLDLNMPRLSGMEVLRQIKSDSRFRKIPVIILSTSDAERDVRDAYECGANAYITKPISFTGVLDMIASINEFWLQLVSRPSFTD